MTAKTDKEQGKSPKYSQEIRHIMYTAGETGEPSIQTIALIEDIVRQQVIIMVAARRGCKSISTNDIFFQIRHHASKVARLRHFLSWKDFRKNAQVSSDNPGDDAGDIDPDSSGPAGPSDDPAVPEEAPRKFKKAKITLPWEPSSFFSHKVPDRGDAEEGDDADEEADKHMALHRLQTADKRTKAMTKEEYVRWSEYRQASFTYRKGKKFREWVGFGVVTESEKPSEDIMDILGFLTGEMVQTITEAALGAKAVEDRGNGHLAGEEPRKRTLFDIDPPTANEERAAVEARHVRLAFERLQARPMHNRMMLNGSNRSARYGLKLSGVLTWLPE